VPWLEADMAVVHGRIIEGFRMPFARDVYYETVIVPGFSDTHMHPQVVDGGVKPGRLWRHSYEWIERRELAVDEAAIRSDLDLSTRLARATFKRAILEGVTLVAVTGNAEANVRAWLSLHGAPKAVFLPTIIRRPGWPTLEGAWRILARLRGMIDDGTARLGVFVHSIRFAGRDQLVEAVRNARAFGGLVGMHLSEGLPEGEEYARITGGNPPGVRVVAVHCIDDEDPGRYGLLCSACPASNLTLYGRTRRSLQGVTSFGSDWPLLLGTVARHIGLITSVFGGYIEEILRRMTVGGYRDYGLSYSGDLVAFDIPLRRLLQRYEEPRLVMSSGRIVVDEGRLVATGEDISDVTREIRGLIKEAIDRYGTGLGSRDPQRDALEALQASMRLYAYSIYSTSSTGMPS
jgi:hypothetical protein